MKLKFDQILADIAPLCAQLLPALQSSLLLALKTLTHCLIQGEKIVIHGIGLSQLNADRLTFGLRQGLELARPALPALTLPQQLLASLTPLTAAQQSAKAAGLLRLLGAPNDVFVLLNAFHAQAPLQPLIESAQLQKMAILLISPYALTPNKEGQPAEHVHVALPALQAPRLAELETTVVHLICELLDHMLFEQGTPQSASY